MCLRAACCMYCTVVRGCKNIFQSVQKGARRHISGSAHQRALLFETNEHAFATLWIEEEGPPHLVDVDGEGALGQSGRLHGGDSSENSVGQTNDGPLGGYEGPHVSQEHCHSDLFVVQMTDTCVIVETAVVLKHEETKPDVNRKASVSPILMYYLTLSYTWWRMAAITSACGARTTVVSP